jgi:N-formylglutamate amidohydrolase
VKIIPGSNDVPVLYTAHHASFDYGEFDGRVALTDEQKRRFSDYGTDLTVPLNGIAALVTERSRALGDLNREPEGFEIFADQDFGKPQPHDIWKKGKELTTAEKIYCREQYYQPFHDEIVNQLRKREELTFVMAWDNTAHYEIGENEAGEMMIMKPFILSNRGREGSGETGNEPASCDPKFLKMLAENFRKELKRNDLPDEVQLNLVMKGGYICRTYSSLRNRDLLKEHGINAEVQSFQLEYDMSITHEMETLEPHPTKIKALRRAFSQAIEQTINAYVKNREKAPVSIAD